MRRSIYAANWKMHKIRSETRDFFKDFIRSVGNRDDVDIVIAPPFTSLEEAVNACRDTTIEIAAQNMHFEPKGAFTGEISASMILDLGCTAVILGHSERRHVFGEGDDFINKKIVAALEVSLQPIFCVGEKIEQRESGQTEEVLDTQIRAGLRGISQERMKNLVIAYEPVWAIGTGLTASPQQAQEAHVYIRKLLEELYGSQVAGTIRILYGGSVKPSNIADLMAEEDLDGVLVGGASLDPESFAGIVNHD